MEGNLVASRNESEYNNLPNDFERRSPPSRDSPQHMLNILTDQCIQHIFKYLVGDIRDFLSASEVCTKFQEIAKMCFPTKYQNISIDPGKKNSKDSLSLKRIEQFLSIFGHLIRSIEWDDYRDKYKYDAAILYVITKYCGNTLTKLNINRRKLKFSNGSQFKALEELRFCSGFVNNFKPPPAIKKLTLVCSITLDNASWLAKTFENLTAITLAHIQQIDDNIFIMLQELNPQLEYLHFTLSNLSSSVFQGIGDRLPRLTFLKFVFRNVLHSMKFKQKFESDIMHLAYLKNLKTFDPRGHLVSKSGLIESFAHDNLTIEELYTDGKNSRVILSLCKLKHLKNLSFYQSNKDQIINLVKKLPNLETLDLCYGIQMSVDGLMQLLEHGKNLKKLGLFELNMRIDLNTYNQILNLVRDRTEVALRLGERNIDIEYTIHHASKWLKVFTF